MIERADKSINGAYIIYYSSGGSPHHKKIFFSHRHSRTYSLKSDWCNKVENIFIPIRSLDDDDEVHLIVLPPSVR